MNLTSPSLLRVCVSLPMRRGGTPPARSRRTCARCSPGLRASASCRHCLRCRSAIALRLEHDVADLAHLMVGLLDPRIGPKTCGAAQMRHPLVEPPPRVCRPTCGGTTCGQVGATQHDEGVVAAPDDGNDLAWAGRQYSRWLNRLTPLLISMAALDRSPHAPARAVAALHTCPPRRLALHLAAAFGAFGERCFGCLQRGTAAPTGGRSPWSVDRLGLRQRQRDCCLRKAFERAHHVRHSGALCRVPEGGE